MTNLLWQIEINITLFFQNLGSWLTPIMQLFTFLGNEEFYLLVMPALYWCVDSAAGLRTGLMLALSGGVNSYFKLLFHSPRPYWIDSRVKAYISETSFGLPSGHSQNAASIWGILASSFKKKWLIITAILVTILIGISRIYLGVHFTRDVLSGWLIGCLLLFLFTKLEKPVVRWIQPKSFSYQIVTILLISAVMILLGYCSWLVSASFVLPQTWIDQSIASSGTAPDPFNLNGVYTISGVFFGFATGFAWIYKKYGFPSVAGSLSNKIIRYFLGLMGLIVLYAALKLLFPENPVWLAHGLRFIRYALIGFWVSAGAPLIFKKLKLDR